MTDRDFWLTVRRALLMVVRAIEKKYPADNVLLEPSDTDTIAVAISE